MVPISDNNPYFLRELLAAKAQEGLATDSFKSIIFDIFRMENTDSDISGLPKYRQCAIAGFKKEISVKLDAELKRLFGQAHNMAGTPSPWVSDIWAVLGIKIAVVNSSNHELIDLFNEWMNGFLPQRLKDARLSAFETALAEYIVNGRVSAAGDITAQLFLTHIGLLPQSFGTALADLSKFQEKFAALRKGSIAPLELGLAVLMFDALIDTSTVPPPGLWSLEDLLRFLNEIPSGLRRWTWENKSKTGKGHAVKWYVDNEYHVQNLLYILLGPLFPDITDEFYTEPVGQKRPRGDLFIPTLDTIIEVKYRKDTKKSFSDLIGEVGEDASLYRADPKFKKSKLIVFLWDQTRSSQEHAKFKEGVKKMGGIDGCIVISSPSPIEISGEENSREN